MLRQAAIFAGLGVAHGSWRAQNAAASARSALMDMQMRGALLPSSPLLLSLCVAAFAWMDALPMVPNAVTAHTLPSWSMCTGAKLAGAGIKRVAELWTCCRAAAGPLVSAVMAGAIPFPFSCCWNVS